MKTTIISTVLPLVAGAALAAAAAAPFVERQIVGYDVRLVAMPPAGVTSYFIKEKPPFGEVGNISEGGSYDPATRTLTFGPFNDGQNRTLTYADSSPAGAEGRFACSGEAVADGVSSAIVGDDYVEIPPFPPLGVRLLLRWRPLSQQMAIQLLGQEPCFVLASTNLLDWVPVGSINPVFGGFELADAKAPNHPRRFYRAQTIPPPPQPLGNWTYQAFDAQGSLIVTGLVTFATATSPITGTWEFQAVQTPPSTAHAVGQGSYADAVISGSQVTVPVRRIIDNYFTLIGDMGGDDYIGRWYWDGEGPSQSGAFTAKRKP
jgi:hypothetical protein